VILYNTTGMSHLKIHIVESLAYIFITWLTVTQRHVCWRLWHRQLHTVRYWPHHRWYIRILNSVFGLCCYTSDTGQAEVAIWNMVRGLSPNHRNGERHTAWAFCSCSDKPGTCHTTKMGSPALVLITHFATEIMLIAFLKQGCERPSSGFECHLIADVTECIR